MGDLWDDFRYQVEIRFPPSRRAVGGFLLIVVLGVLGVFGFQAVSARSALNQAASDAELLQDQISAGDVAGARLTLGDLQDHASSAHDRTSGVLWRAGSKIPWAGTSVDAVRTVAKQLDRVSQDAVPPIVELADKLSATAFSPRDGKVDVAAFEKISPAVARSAASLAKARNALDSIDVGALFAPLRGAVSTVQFKIGTASEVAHNADLAARLLPDLLGRDGTRRYLLMVQNNAESRPLGGITGSFAEITVKNGRIDLTSTGSAPDLPPFDTPVVKLGKDEQRVFPSSMASDLRDVNVTPSFPRAAQIAAKLYERKFDTSIDGVVSVDPVALSYLLAGLGQVEVTDKLSIDQNSVVNILLYQVYKFFPDRRVQDEFFEQITEKVFDAFTAGAGDPVTTLRGLVRGVEENRVMLWSATTSEQKLIAPTELSGEWPDDRDSTPRVGVFLSDAASTKMEYFLDASTSLSSQNCLDDHQVVTTTTQLTSNAPDGGLPVTIAGDGGFVKKGQMRLNIRLFSPTGGHFTSVRLDGKPVTVNADEWRGRNVSRLEVVLKPGQTRTITANVTSAKGQTGDPELRTTPTVISTRNDFSVPSACRP